MCVFGFLERLRGLRFRLFGFRGEKRRRRRIGIGRRVVDCGDRRRRMERRSFRRGCCGCRQGMRAWRKDEFDGVEVVRALWWRLVCRLRNRKNCAACCSPKWAGEGCVGRQAMHPESLGSVKFPLRTGRGSSCHRGPRGLQWLRGKHVVLDLRLDQDQYCGSPTTRRRLTNLSNPFIRKQSLPHLGKVSLFLSSPPCCSFVFIIRIPEVHLCAPFSAKSTASNISVQFLHALFVVCALLVTMIVSLLHCRG